LNIPGFVQPWESKLASHGKPDHVASSLDIMIQGPLGGAAFNNEFGRPSLCGFFRTYLETVDGEVFGYHKPIMIAGGVGSVRPEHALKKKIYPGCKLIAMGFVKILNSCL
jgi:phosphoribosylformylglycinamidine synthase